MPQGTKWAEWNAERVMQMVINTSKERMADACQMLVDKIRQKMETTELDPSRRFWSKELKAMHTPSRPGYPPAIMTGNLYEALDYRVKVEGDVVIGLIGVGLDEPESEGYAIYLELGTDKMAQRPYLRATMFENEDEIRKMLNG